LGWAIKTAATANKRYVRKNKNFNIEDGSSQNFLIFKRRSFIDKEREKGFEVFIQSKHGLIGIIETNFDTTPNCETYFKVSSEKSDFCLFTQKND